MMRFSLRSSSPIRTGMSLVCSSLISEVQTSNSLKTSSARRHSTNAHRACAAPDVRFEQHSRLQPRRDTRGDRRRAHRRSCFAAHRRASRAVGSSHHVSTPAATSRRSPDGVDRDSTSPSTETMTREMPGPSRSPRAADPHFAIAVRSSASAVGASGRCRTPASSGCGRRGRIETDSPTPSPRHRHRQRSDPSRLASTWRNADDDVLAERLHQRHADRRRRSACTLRRTSSRPSRARHCRLTEPAHRSSHAVVRQRRSPSRKSATTAPVSSCLSSALRLRWRPTGIGRRPTLR